MSCTGTNRVVQQHHGQTDSVRTPQQTWQSAKTESLGLGTRKKTTGKDAFPANHASRNAACFSVTNDSTLMIAYHSTVRAPAHLQTKKAVSVAPGLLVWIHHVFSTNTKPAMGVTPFKRAGACFTHTHTPSRGGAIFSGGAAHDAQNPRVCSVARRNVSAVRWRAITKFLKCWSWSACIRA